ncbi:polysaccharide biosynthesis/export family protein [Sphingobacterium sp.]|uniref:polysaccharide biosynthesis/export family protein n=1 Tax=Sphingobacterium sp. TaxID=341027 RepID=UPI00289B039D|nr:polysaccharide biosynthesis/export family protein [Sphingobacterium sp.]
MILQNRLQKQFTLYCSILFMLIIVSSCATRKEIVYFNKSDSLLNTIYQQNVPRIQSNDKLAILISAPDQRSVGMFQMQTSPSTSQQMRDVRPTYTVDQNGDIYLPTLGAINLKNLSRVEAIVKIREELKKFVQEPVVNLEIVNFKISVLGDVGKPGIIEVDNDRITLLEAISASGDLAITGKRNNVLVIREQDGKRSSFRVDLTSSDYLNSPAYHLMQNDVVYVEPNKAKIQTANATRNLTLGVSLLSFVLTLYNVLSR